MEILATVSFKCQAKLEILIKSFVISSHSSMNEYLTINTVDICVSNLSMAECFPEKTRQFSTE